MTNEAVLYTVPGCGPCVATKRAMMARSIPFRIVDMAQDKDAAEYVLGLGYRSAPVTVAPDGTHWHGLDTDRLTSLAVWCAA